MIWVAVHLPLLSLEAFASTLPEGGGGSDADGERRRPIALLDGQQIVAVDRAARSLGVQPGLKRATALTLAPQLLFGQADPIRDAEALQAIAHAVLAFTPAVSIQPPSEAAAPHALADRPHTVLLEVQASLRYFGGLPRLLQRLEAELAPFGHRLHLVTAATPLGAALLARVHRRLQCADRRATVDALEQAPIWLLGPGRAHWEALQGMGLHTIADLRRVPRDGLARRFGPVVLDEFDRATGRAADPRRPIELPPSFESRLELYARVENGEQLLHGASVLLARLIGWLSAQHAFVRRWTLVLGHERRSRHDETAVTRTALEIALAEPSRDAAHLLALLRERLLPLTLPAPTMDLRLVSNDIVRRAPPNSELFPTAANEHEGLVRLVERLQARLGREQVRRLVAVDDHRPEKATAYPLADRCPGAVIGSSMSSGSSKPTRPPDTSSAASVFGSTPRPTTMPWRAGRPVRPVWLMLEPEPLPERTVWSESGRQQWPLVDGQPLQLLSGPERIETGWWEGDGAVERDYFIARKPDGALVWIFRERVPQPDAPCGWFLQGRFG